MRKELYLPNNQKTRHLLHAIADEQRVTKASFNSIIREALEEHVEKRKVWVQAQLTDFQEEFIMQMETLHSEFVYPNPNHYPDWRTALQKNQILTEETIEYSQKRGWRVESRKP